MLSAKCRPFCQGGDGLSHRFDTMDFSCADLAKTSVIVILSSEENIYVDLSYILLNFTMLSW